MPKDSDQHSEQDPKKAMADALRRALKNKASAPHNDFPGSDSPGSAGKGHKQVSAKARNFRHQGR
ncbi:MAG TPA: hypothetical protein VG798_07210 [Rhizomicrobium sp.]|jgi:hypothetical protein|nr:hypothetical protein [Rhizomicrobium sp.]